MAAARHKLTHILSHHAGDGPAAAAAGDAGAGGGAVVHASGEDPAAGAQDHAHVVVVPAFLPQWLWDLMPR